MIKEKFYLKNKIAIITGSSKGIGKAMARGLAEFGATVVVSSRKQEAVAQVAEEFKELKFSAEVICHASEQWRRHNDNQKRSANHVAVELRVDEVAAEKSNHIRIRSSWALRCGDGVVENGENRGRDDQEIGGICPVVHQPPFADGLIGIGPRRAF